MQEYLGFHGTGLDHCMHSVFHVVSEYGYLFHDCDCVLHITWKTYTRYDVYEKCDCVIITQKKEYIYIYIYICIHGKMYMGKVEC